MGIVWRVWRVANGRDDFEKMKVFEKEDDVSSDGVD